MTTSEGVSTHLNFMTRGTMDDVFSIIDLERTNSQAADTIGWRLNTLSLPITIDAQTRAHAGEEIAELRQRSNLTTAGPGQMLRSIKSLGMLPSRGELREFMSRGSRTFAFYRAHHLPLGKPHII